MIESNNPKIQEATKICEDFGQGKLPLEEALTRLEETFGLEPNLFERERIRRAVEAIPNEGGTVLLLESLQSWDRALDLETETSHAIIEQSKTGIKMANGFLSLQTGALEFFQYVSKESPELGKALGPIHRKYSSELHEKFLVEADRLNKLTEEHKNLIKADSFEGVSEFAPDTVEELLGDTENK